MAISLAETSGVHSTLHLTGGGRFSAAILLGDVRGRDAVEWILGEIILEFAPVRRAHTNESLYSKPLLYSSDQTLTPLPEITHQMRPPPERASLVMSFLFTALSLMPLACLVFFMMCQKPNLNRLTSGSGMAFVVCLLGALSLYTGYWLALPGFDFYSTIKYMCILFPCLLLVGRRALGFLIDNDNGGKQRKRV